VTAPSQRPRCLPYRDASARLGVRTLSDHIKVRGKTRRNIFSDLLVLFLSFVPEKKCVGIKLTIGFLDFYAASLKIALSEFYNYD